MSQHTPLSDEELALLPQATKWTGDTHWGVRTRYGQVLK